MSDLKHRIRPGWADELRRVLEKATAAKASGLLVFDLDSTVFDNRPRQSRIVRELGKAKGLPPLMKCGVEHWTSGWDLKAAMVACGLTDADADALYKEAKAFWVDRFFTSEYCVDDVEVPGATSYLHAAVKTGAQVLYVTGRHEAMRSGTVKCFEKCGMPVPGGAVQLLMKPTLRESDDGYKRDTHARLKGLGTLVAAFDNEPTHINDYALQFPDAVVIHLATDHSGRPVELHPRTVSVPDFRI